MWTEKARSWRKQNKRGVSPIIATILLVAITVVLAAVLYILISGLTGGGNNKPVGTALALGSATPYTGGFGCTSSENCYQITVQSAASGITWGNLHFQVKTAGGSIVGLTNVTILGLSGTSADVWTATSDSWTSTGLAISSTQTVIVNVGANSGTTSASALSGGSFSAIGSSPFTGSISVTLP